MAGIHFLSPIASQSNMIGNEYPCSSKRRLMTLVTTSSLQPAAIENAPSTGKGSDQGLLMDLSRLCAEGKLKEAVNFLEQQDQAAEPSTYAALLRLCGDARAKALLEGRRVHAYINKYIIDAESGISNFLGDHLVQMYHKCGSVLDAQEVFDRMSCPSTISWNRMVAVYAQNGFLRDAIRIMQQMGLDNILINRGTLITLLNVCSNLASLAEGKFVHASILDSDFKLDVVVITAVINMYAVCENLGYAYATFEKLPQKDVVAWNAMVAVLAEHGHESEAIQLFWQIIQHGIRPSRVSFITVLNACTCPSALMNGKLFHAYIICNELEADVHVGTALINMYGRCDSLEDAEMIFQKLQHKNMVTWNTMLSINIQNGDGKEALNIFFRMRRNGLDPEVLTFLTVVDACTSLNRGKLVHASIIGTDLETKIVTSNALLHLYGKHGSLDYASRIFNTMHEHNVVSWNSIITPYVGKTAISFLRQMQHEKVMPNEITFINILNTCPSPAFMAEGKVLHAQTIMRGFELDVVVGTALISMYAKCENLESACNTFNRMQQRNVITWTSLIAAFSQNGHSSQVFQLFQEMHQHNLKGNVFTFTTILNSCFDASDLALGRLIHAHAVSAGYQPGVILDTALMNMYGNCGDLEVASLLFENMQQKDVISWNCIIGAYGMHGYPKQAVELFQNMLLTSTKPSKVTYISIFTACSNIGAFVQSKWVHAYILHNATDFDVSVGNSIIDTYNDCGRLEDAYEAFGKMQQKDIISWNTIISASSQNGSAEKSLNLFQEMLQEGSCPDRITFIAIISSCSHAGLVDDGCHYFVSISGDNSGTPYVENYGSLVDLFGRRGWLDEAEDLACAMPFTYDAAWMSLLGACRIHGNTFLGNKAAEHVFDMVPNKSSVYIELSNIYAADGSWD